MTTPQTQEQPTEERFIAKTHPLRPSADRWVVAYNTTRSQWMVWANDSPAIAFCYAEADAERIAALLNAAGVE